MAVGGSSAAEQMAKDVLRKMKGTRNLKRVDVELVKVSGSREVAPEF
jgi:hypothetical protein